MNKNLTRFAASCLFRPSSRWLPLLHCQLDRIPPVALDLEALRLGSWLPFDGRFWFLGHSLVS
jgi:hypothetical protein